MKKEMRSKQISLCGMQKGMATPIKSWAVSDQNLHLLHLSITAISLWLTLKNETYAHTETSTQRVTAVDFRASGTGKKSPALPNPYGQRVTDTGTHKLKYIQYVKLVKFISYKFLFQGSWIRKT